MRTISRQALNILRILSRLRDNNLGPLLPEPLLTMSDVPGDVVLAKNACISMLAIL
ncbi:hypothetical protein [Glutamicibacter sp. 0426]|uniref:hypothetical protein n=1 Tax=Glutamicibacter sp. 0426 TaxID=1913445 RepID=UPI0013019784|nr:hypothetical protein [Glutamicibacter sp. 0426]